VRSAKRSRQTSWWYGLTAIVVIAGIAGIVFTQATKAAPVGPFLANSSNPTKKDTHWHASLGMYNCDRWLSDGTGAGVWNWPQANAGGSPSQASNPSVYAGMHSHDDGVIHMEPLVTAETGKNTTIGLYFKYGGWKVSSTGFSFLGTTVKNGDQCAGGPGTLQWEVGKWDGTTGKQKYTVQTGNPADYKLFQDDVVVIAFLPPGKSIASIGDSPALPNLGKALGVSETPGTVTTMPPIATPTTGGPTPTTAKPTTPTSKP
jgi:hypothetical protein